MIKIWASNFGALIENVWERYGQQISNFGVLSQWSWWIDLSGKFLILALKSLWKEDDKDLSSKFLISVLSSRTSEGDMLEMLATIFEIPCLIFNTKLDMLDWFNRQISNFVDYVFEKGHLFTYELDFSWANSDRT